MTALPGRWPLVVLLAVAPPLLLGLFARSIWTPDEPREIALAWNIAQQHDKAVPSLAGEPFSEKPPLTYWLAGASMQAFGKSAAAARIPNLAYALLGTFAVALLARGLLRSAGRAGAEAALGAAVAGVAFGTMELSWQVQIWLASDAPLLAGTSVALLGAWQGLDAPPGRSKLTGYALMHAGMLLGFFSKNLIGWIIPGLALLGFLAWEQRWRELQRWELWAPLAVQAAAILAWVMAVADHANGARLLRIFFVDNLLGRFLPIPGEVTYHTAHRNWPGKYLVELPYYLLPWTLLALAAARRAWRAVREPGPARPAWRFALCIVLPNLALLSVSTTARGVYFAPLLAGMAAILGLWSVEHLGEPDLFERRCLALTLALLAVICLALPTAAVIAIPEFDLSPLFAVLASGGLLAASVGLYLAAQRQRAGTYVAAQACGYAAYVATLCSAGVALIAVGNAVQRLERVGAAVAEEVAQGTRVALLRPDETIRAVLEYHEGLVLPSLEDEPGVRAALAADPQLRLLAKLPRAGGQQQGFLDDVAARFGVIVERRIEIPHGRRYAVLARPPG